MGLFREVVGVLPVYLLASESFAFFSSAARAPLLSEVSFVYQFDPLLGSPKDRVPRHDGACEPKVPVPHHVSHFVLDLCGVGG